MRRAQFPDAHLRNKPFADRQWPGHRHDITSNYHQFNSHLRNIATPECGRGYPMHTETPNSRRFRLTIRIRIKPTKVQLVPIENHSIKKGEINWRKLTVSEWNAHTAIGASARRSPPPPPVRGSASVCVCRKWTDRWQMEKECSVSFAHKYPSARPNATHLNCSGWNGGTFARCENGDRPRQPHRRRKSLNRRSRKRSYDTFYCVSSHKMQIGRPMVEPGEDEDDDDALHTRRKMRRQSVKWHLSSRTKTGRTETGTQKMR